MALGIKEFFQNFGRKKSKTCRVSPADYTGDLAQEIQIREAAFHSCTNLIANCISKCELRTYQGGKFVKDREWYRWNVQPNPNQNATAFWQKLVHRLYEDNEALILHRPNGELYVVDDFEKDNTSAFRPHTYHGIKIDGLSYEPVLTDEQVFYFALHDVNVKDLVDDVTGLYGKLIAAFISSYTEARGTKGILYVDQIAEQEEDFEEHLTEIINEDFKKLYTSQNAVMPLFNGYRYEELSRDTNPGIDTRDFHSQINDVFELYAMAFGIPKALVTGEVQDTSKAVDQLLTFALDPVLELIADELNRKLFSVDEYLKGDFVRWRTNSIKHIDILDVAGNVEKLISSGFTCIDEIREACGLDPLDEAWAQQFFMTKNFSTIEDLLQSVTDPQKESEVKTDEKGNNGGVANSQSGPESSGPEGT